MQQGFQWYITFDVKELVIETQSQTAAEPALDVMAQSESPDVDWAKSAIEAIGRYKDNPEFLKRLFDGAAEARREINAEYLRELDEQAKK